MNEEIYNQILSNDERFFAITIIQETGCATCIKEEIEATNNLSKESLHQLIVIFVGENEDALKNSGLSMDYLFYNSFDEIFIELVELDTLNPMSLVLDKNFIYELRKVDLTKPKDTFLTKSYYIYLESLFSL